MVLFYDVNYQRTGVSTTTYPDITGTTRIDLYEDLRQIFLAREIFPLDDYRNPSATYSNYGLYYVVSPMLKVTSGLETAPFVSYPEPRYRVGSYSYIKGYEVIEPPDEPPIYRPYNSEPVYLHYQHSALAAGYLIVDPANPFSSALKVDLTGGGVGSIPSLPVIVNPYYSGAFVSEYCGGITINLSPGLTADLFVSYQYSVVDLPLDPAYGYYLYVY